MGNEEKDEPIASKQESTEKIETQPKNVKKAKKEEDRPLKKESNNIKGDIENKKEKHKREIEKAVYKQAFTIIYVCIGTVIGFGIISVLLLIFKVEDSSLVDEILDLIKTIIMLILGFVFANKKSE